jgi:integrase
MPTQRCIIDNGIITQARAMAASGNVADHIFADEEAAGLRLRVRKRNVSWELKSGGRTLCIGQLDRMFAKEARTRARIGRDLLAGKVDPNPFFRARLAGLSEAESRRVAHEEHGTLKAPGAEDGPVWTFDELMREYIDRHVSQPKPDKNGELKPASEHTVKQVHSLIARSEFDRIRKIALGNLNAKLLKEVGKQIAANSSEGRGSKALIYVKSALSWAKRSENPPSGLSDAWWRDIKIVPSAPTRIQNTLFVEDIGYLLAVAELSYAHAGGNKRLKTSEITICMLWWLVLTLQRTTASSLVARAHVMKHRREGWTGWGVVTFPAQNMKSRRFHAIPLPPVAMGIVERAYEAAEKIGRGDSQWLFPSLRTASKKRTRCDKRATARAVDQLIRRIRGISKDLTAVKSPDLLGGMPHFTPHNMRHSFCTHFGDTSCLDEAVAAVLDHSVVSLGNMQIRRSPMSDVYNKSYKLPLKAQVLYPWCHKIYENYEAALAKLQATDPRYADAKPWRFKLEEGVQDRPLIKKDGGFDSMR